MFNVIIGILAILSVYGIEAIICFGVLKLLKHTIGKNDPNPKITYIASVRALHVVALVLVIYFIPLLALVICLAIDSLLVVPIIMLIFALLPVVINKIIIPVSDKKRMQLMEKYYGPDDVNDERLLEQNK